jgi:hypothetical protein
VNSPPAPLKDSEAKVYVVFPSISPPNTEVGTFYYYTINPSHGPAGGGTGPAAGEPGPAVNRQVVTITGSGLKDVSAVKFGEHDGIDLTEIKLDGNGREYRQVTAPDGVKGSDVPVKLVFPVETKNKISVVGTYHYD